MQKVILDVRRKNDFTAGTKARQDAEIILQQNGFKKKSIVINQTSKNLFSLMINLLTIEKQLKQILERLENNSILLIQYPWDFLSYRLSKIILRYCRAKKITTIALIHDLNIYRTGSKLTSLYYTYLVKEYKFLNNFDFVIAHNVHMANILNKHGIRQNKIVVLKVFDYLSSNVITDNKENDYRIINIAGNLSVDKAGYLYHLDDKIVKSFYLRLYGPNYTGVVHNHIHYMGVVSANELPQKINSGFGLVWDGNSKDTCDGNFGRYLQINNPHKFSLYMACGIPVFVWNRSALADFVEKERLGYSISSLDEINDILNKLTLTEYEKLKKNVSIIQSRVTKGDYLISVINSIPLNYRKNK